MHLPEWMRRRKEPSGSGARPVLQTLTTAVDNLKRVPTLPAAANRAMLVAKDPNSSLAQLAAVIERDPALAAGVLKLANSALYRTFQGVLNLQQAVVRLGMRECQNLILAVGMRSLFFNMPPARQARYAALWRHSFLTGCLCRRLSAALGLRFDGEEFVSGLSHDIGRLLIGLGSPDHAEAADPMDFVEGPDVLLREQAVLGTDHCYFGARFANLNNLPACLVSAVQFHHTPEWAEEHKPLVAVVAVADHLANYFQREQRVEGYEAAGNPAWPVLQEFVPDGRDFVEVADGVLQEAVDEGRRTDSTLGM